MDFSARITFPELYKLEQRFRIQLGSAEEMDVIGHDDVPANSPSMPIMRRVPFIGKNFCDLVTREKFSAILSSRCYEINRRINPDTSKSSQVLMHPGVVAEGVDLGNLRGGYRQRSAPAATASALRGEPRFGFGAGDLADRDAT
jgi:hypothetical protein